MIKEPSMIEKIISLWFSDLPIDYQIHLYESANEVYKKKLDYYVKKGFNVSLAEKGANKYVFNELYKISNIR